MNAPQASCAGDGACACAGTRPAASARINGVELQPPHQPLQSEELLERAWTELLRQHAVERGLLPPVEGTLAPELDDAQRQALEAMIDDEVRVPDPTDDECRRHHTAHAAHFVTGRSVHMRHILFAVTPGVNVHALTQRAEAALMELRHPQAPVDRFPQLAAELSNCPSSTQGGDLGWVAPEDCAPELAQVLFPSGAEPVELGVLPRLAHSRYGLHIVEVLERRPGQALAFEDVLPALRQSLKNRSRAVALRQYMRLLVGRAKVEGIDLEGSASPLVQ